MTKTKFKTIPKKAREYIETGAAKPVSKMKANEIPPVAVSWGNTTVFKTGAWRNVTPEYVRRLPPCRAGCPVGNDVEGWLEAVGDGEIDKAVQLLLAEQPLPSICGRVCYHPCEKVCNREQFDGAVSIRAVERFLGDYAAKSRIALNIAATQKTSLGKILVAGSGPAGLAAAWTLVQLGYKVEVHDLAPKLGGLLRYGIPDYRLPGEILDMELDNLKQLGIKFKSKSRVDFDDLVPIRREFAAIFLAPGAAGHRSSGIRNREGVVINAIDFLQASTGPKSPVIGTKVVVIGGGNSALDAARTALRYGAEVSILYRRTRAEMPAFEEEIEAALDENIRIEYLINPLSILRSDEPRLRCIRNRLGSPDSSGRRSPEPISGSEFDIPIDTVVDAVGEYPDPSYLTADRDIQPLLRSDDIWGRTGLENVWCGGDFSGGERTVAHAIGSGKRVAIDIDLKLKGAKKSEYNGLLYGFDKCISAQKYISRDSDGWYDNLSAVETGDLNTTYFPPIKRQSQAEAKPSKRVQGFAEIIDGLVIRQVKRESERCFHCGQCDSCGNCHVFCPDGSVIRDLSNGALSFDLEHCKGCGICDAECPRAAIEMVK